MVESAVVHVSSLVVSLPSEPCSAGRALVHSVFMAAIGRTRLHNLSIKCSKIKISLKEV